MNGVWSTESLTLSPTLSRLHLVGRLLIRPINCSVTPKLMNIRFMDYPFKSMTLFNGRSNSRSRSLVCPCRVIMGGKGGKGQTLYPPQESCKRFSSDRLSTGLSVND